MFGRTFDQPERRGPRRPRKSGADKVRGVLENQILQEQLDALRSKGTKRGLTRTKDKFDPLDLIQRLGGRIQEGNVPGQPTAFQSGLLGIGGLGGTSVSNLLTSTAGLGMQEGGQVEGPMAKRIRILNELTGAGEDQTLTLEDIGVDRAEVERITQENLQGKATLGLLQAMGLIPMQAQAFQGGGVPQIGQAPGGQFAQGRSTLPGFAGAQSNANTGQFAQLPQGNLGFNPVSATQGGGPTPQIDTGGAPPPNIGGTPPPGAPAGAIGLEQAVGGDPSSVFLGSSGVQGLPGAGQQQAQFSGGFAMPGQAPPGLAQGLPAIPGQRQIGMATNNAPAQATAGGGGGPQQLFPGQAAGSQLTGEAGFSTTGFQGGGMAQGQAPSIAQANPLAQFAGAQPMGMGKAAPTGALPPALPPLGASPAQAVGGAGLAAIAQQAQMNPAAALGQAPGLAQAQAPGLAQVPGMAQTPGIFGQAQAPGIFGQAQAPGAKSPFAGFQAGGPIPGPATPADSVPALLTGGELVVPLDIVRELEQITPETDTLLGKIKALLGKAGEVVTFDPISPTPQGQQTFVRGQEGMQAEGGGFLEALGLFDEGSSLSQLLEALSFLADPSMAQRGQEQQAQQQLTADLAAVLPEGALALEGDLGLGVEAGPAPQLGEVPGGVAPPPESILQVDGQRVTPGGGDQLEGFTAATRFTPQGAQAGAGTVSSFGTPTMESQLLAAGASPQEVEMARQRQIAQARLNRFETFAMQNQGAAERLGPEIEGMRATVAAIDQQIALAGAVRGQQAVAQTEARGRMGAAQIEAAGRVAAAEAVDPVDALKIRLTEAVEAGDKSARPALDALNGLSQTEATTLEFLLSQEDPNLIGLGLKAAGIDIPGELQRDFFGGELRIKETEEFSQDEAVAALVQALVASGQLQQGQ